MLLIQSPTHADPFWPAQSFCGPAVLSAITGLTTDEVCRRIIHLISGCRRGQVRGMSYFEMVGALGLLGFNVKNHSYGMLCSVPKRRRGWWSKLVYEGDLDGETEMQWKGRPTLTRWARERDEVMHNAPCVLAICNHWIVVQADDVADNKYGLVALSESRYRRRRIRRALVVTSSDA